MSIAVVQVLLQAGVSVNATDLKGKIKKPYRHFYAMPLEIQFNVMYS